MGSKLHNKKIIEKIKGFVNKFILKHWQLVSTKTVDTFSAEIHQLEQKLSQAPTRPIPTIRHHSTLLEPVTEQQKIMDMSG